MTTYPNIGLILPERGAAGSGEWHDTIDDDLALLDAHDHTSGKGLAITTAAIDIDANLSLAGFAAEHIGRLTFDSVAALTANNKSVFVSSADNELYWRTNTGTNVKLTSGAALNVAAFVGGIGGDYAAVGALLDYDDATDTYRFRQETAAAVRQFAKIKCADIQLIEYDAAGDASVPASAITIKSPDALAGAYSLTLPAALPGSTSLVQLDSAGVLTASNTVANAVTLSASLSVGTTAAVGTSLTVGTTLAVTGTTTAAAVNPTTVTASGLVTANAGVTAGSNQHITVSGTGRHKHGLMTLSVPPTAFVSTDSTLAVTYSPAGLAGINGVGLQAIAPIDLPLGCRIVNIRVYVDDNTTGPTTIQAILYSVSSAGASTVVAGPATSNGSGGNQTLTLSSINLTIATTVAYSIAALASAANLCKVYLAEVDYDLP